MDVYTTEEEQIEAIKKWWKENGKAIIFGVVVGLSAIFGWRSWQTHIIQKTEAASALYQQILISIRDAKTDQAKTAAQKVLDEYDDTSYAILARLMLAKFAVQDKELDKAEGLLRSALDKTKPESMQLEIRLRLARLLKEKQDYDQALSLLNIEERGAYDSQYEELKGDILVAQGKTGDAFAAYQQAFLKARSSRDTSLLEMKMDDLGKTDQ